MNSKLKRVVAVATLATVVAAPVVAKPVMQKINAYLNPTITYTLDGEKILTDVNTVTYKNKNYVPVADLVKALGKEVTFENGKVMITTPSVEAPEKLENITIPKAKIIEINTKNNQVTILPEGKADTIDNYIILNVSDNTVYKHVKNKRMYHLEDLEKGMMVKVVHAPLMTASIPPQTPTYKIIILEEDYEMPPVADNGSESKDQDIEDAKILEVNHSQKYLLVESKEGKIKVPFTNKTKVEFENEKKKPNVNSLKVGQIVDIEIKNGVAIEIEVND